MSLFTPIGGYFGSCLHLYLQVDNLVSLFKRLATGGYLGATVYTCSYRWILGCHCLHLYLHVDTWVPLFTPVATGGYLDATVYTCSYRWIPGCIVYTCMYRWIFGCHCLHM